MIKKLTSLILAILLILSFTGCSQSGADSTIGGGETNKQEEQATEEVIFDNDNVKVTYFGINELALDVGYSYLNLRIENKTDTEVWVTMPYCSIDEETVPFIVQGATSIHIKPGKTHPSTFGLQMFNLSIDSLKNAKEIEFTLKAVDKENITTVVFEETMKIDFNK